MHHQEGTFRGTGGLELYYQRWLPEGTPRAIVIICHGVADHGGRYPSVVARLVSEGYAVYAHDHRGHGRSAGEKLHVQRFQLYVDDLRIFRDWVAAQHPAAKLFLFGHSMGNTVALQYLLAYPTAADGLISSGTTLYAGEGFPQILLVLNQVLSRLLPHLRLTKLPTEGISRDPAWVQQTLHDPLVYHGPGTTRLGAEIIRALEGLRPRLAEITLPLLILQGENDILVDRRGSQLLYAQAASSDKTLKIYAEAYHEVFNDLPPSQAAFLGDLAAWLSAHV
jgi:acylglycerol lipase